jgi:hypothetical protein
LDEEVFPEDISAARLIEMLERLPLLDGILTKRAMLEAQEGGQGQVSGVTVGSRPGPGSPTPYSPTGSRTSEGDVEVVESSGRVLTTHPALAGLVDFAQV